MIDFSSEFGQKALQRLNSEEFIWLTVVDDKGVAQPNPVWFIWQDESLLIYTLTTAKRLKHLAKHPIVSLHFNADAVGENVVVFTGEAKVKTLSGDANPQYIKKYADGIIRIGFNNQRFFETYAVEMRVTPSNVRGF